MAEEKLTAGFEKLKVCVGGGGGFIGSHLAVKLRSEGHWVRCVDWKANEYFAESGLARIFTATLNSNPCALQSSVTNLCFWI